MELVSLVEMECGNCRERSEQLAPQPFATRGAYDLDTRLPEPIRYTMASWVQQCPRCGLCSKRLASPPNGAALVQSAPYRRALEDKRFPVLARRFLAAAVLLDGDDPRMAARRRLSAAWVCDDATPATGAGDLATECRLLVAGTLLLLKPFETTLVRELGIILVDVLRRASRFNEARAEVATLHLRSPELDPAFRLQLDLEARLIGRGDVHAHTPQEATNLFKQTRDVRDLAPIRLVPPSGEAATKPPPSGLVSVATTPAQTQRAQPSSTVAPAESYRRSDRTYH